MVKTRHSTVLDSSRQRLGLVYAKALLGAAEKAGNSPTVLAELTSFLHDVLDALPQLDAVLCSPRVSFERKERILDRVCGGKATTQLVNFLKVLARRGRFDCLRAVEPAARQLFNELRGRVEARVVSAQPLDAATLTLVADRLRVVLRREVDLHTQVDPELVGGLVIRVGDTVYDGSVANQLRRLREEVMAKSNQKIRLDMVRFAGSD
jgi:F-type H+-transporting ATPase subunit delta